MRCSMIRRQHPQSPPAPLARDTSARERAPSRIRASISRSVTEWQMQRIKAARGEIENASQFHQDCSAGFFRAQADGYMRYRASYWPAARSQEWSRAIAPRCPARQLVVEAELGGDVAWIPGREGRELLLQHRVAGSEQEELDAALHHARHGLGEDVVTLLVREPADRRAKHRPGRRIETHLLLQRRLAG